MISDRHESIAQRIKDAEILWRSGRMEGAFILALIAVSAAARVRRPLPFPDGKAFEGIFNDYFHSDLISIEYRGTDRSIWWVLYKLLRCQLVHEGALFKVTFLSQDATMERPPWFDEPMYLDPEPGPEVPALLRKPRRQAHPFTALIDRVVNVTIKRGMDDDSDFLQISPDMFWILVGLVECEIEEGVGPPFPRLVRG